MLPIEIQTYSFGVDPIIYDPVSVSTLCPGPVYICSLESTGPTCTISSEGEAEQSTYFYIAGGAVVFLEVLYLWRTDATLFFASIVFFRSFDLCRTG